MKNSLSHKGQIPWNKGIKTGPVSEETKKKISTSLAGKPRSRETKEKISIAHKGNKHCVGRKCSEETKKKISETLKGNIPWNKGKKTGPQSEEIRKRTSEAVTKWWAERKINKINNSI